MFECSQALNLAHKTFDSEIKNTIAGINEQRPNDSLRKLFLDSIAEIHMTYP